MTRPKQTSVAKKKFFNEAKGGLNPKAFISFTYRYRPIQEALTPKADDKIIEKSPVERVVNESVRESLM